MKPKRRRLSRSEFVYDYRGWVLYPQGGFITMKLFWGRKPSEPERYIWAFQLRKVCELIDKLEAGELVENLYLKPLYQ